MTQLTFSSASIKLVEPGSILSSSSNNTATFSVDVEKKEDLSPALSGCTQQNLNSIELTMSVDQLITSFDPLAVATLVNSLKDDSGVFKIIVLPSTKGGSTTELNISESDSLFDTIRLSFILSGLTPIIEPEEKKEEGYLPKVFTATKNQASSTGTTAAIQIPSSLKSNGVVRLNTKVMLSGLDDDDDNDELIDEDNLLIGNNDLAPPITSSRVKKQDDDCGGRKACDNCSCGRAELEQMGKKAAASTTSSCGNCSKGDAFRCAGCPFLGKPAYKAGEEMLYLDLTDDL